MSRALPLPAFQDNYIWLLPGEGGRCVVVDPGDAEPVLAAAGDLSPAAILLTHHHADHVGGASALAGALGIPVYAPEDARIALDARRVRDGERIRPPGTGLAFDVLAVPGHTLSHVAFHGAGHLFCGDTLFSLGCGRMFEGTPTQMLASLDRLAALPGDTWVCCGHEYTEANGRFARTVEPDNPARESHLADVARRRARGEPSLPSSLAQERAGNPFLRLDAPGVHASLTARLGRPPRDRVEAFAVLRAWKDGFTA